jgi:excisionase family DNA binding protein
MRDSGNNLTLSEKLALTVDEFCELVSIGRTTFYKAVDAGDLRIRKYGRRSFVTQEEAKRFVENMPLA